MPSPSTAGSGGGVEPLFDAKALRIMVAAKRIQAMTPATASRSKSPVRPADCTIGARMIAIASELIVLKNRR